MRKYRQKDISGEVTRRLKIQNKKLLEQVALLRAELKQEKTGRNEMSNRLNRLIKLNSVTSQALGSCADCWGRDPGCPNCSGNGSPGWRNINRRLFNIYILPALEEWYGPNEKIKTNARR